MDTIKMHVAAALAGATHSTTTATSSTGTTAIDLTQPSFWIAAGAIAFNPLFWNVVAQTEYKSHWLTRIFRSPYTACYFLAITIFSLSLFRDHLYNLALSSQPFTPWLHHPVLGATLFVAGQLLTLPSMYALGITGTYLGDYFGILMDAPVTGYPFNVTGAPMYWGSTMSFLGTALWFGKAAGFLLTVEVTLCYLVALQFEDPFTAEIYAKREREGRSEKKKL